jgi:hypothetical protein
LQPAEAVLSLTSTFPGQMLQRLACLKVNNWIARSTVDGHHGAMSQRNVAKVPSTLMALSRPITVVVADAMILIRMSCRLALASEPSVLAVDVTKTGRARIYITAEVEREVTERMAKVVKHVTVEAALEAWRTRLAPSIVVVDLPFGEILNPSVRRIVAADPDDVLTGALALKIGPALVWSEDRSLTATGFASRLSWQETGEALVDVATTEAAWAGGLDLANLTGNALLALMMASVRCAQRGSPQALGVGFTVGATLLWLIGPRGAHWARTTSALATTTRIGTECAKQLVTRWDAAEERLYRVQPSGLDGLVEGAARLLARAPVPMTAAELRDELRRSRRPGLIDREITAVALERALVAHPAFRRVARQRWILGRPVRFPLVVEVSDA